MVPIPTRPAEVIRSLSLPAVSTVNVSSAGNLIAVLVSPVWIILSAIEKSPVAPDAFDAVPVTLPSKVVAVTTPLTLIPPVPVMNLPLRSKFPPNCGVVSPTILVEIPVRLV